MTHRRTRIPGEISLFPQPSARCRIGWKCQVCEASSDALKCKPYQEGPDVYCSICGFNYTLQVPPPHTERRYVPKSVGGADWRRVWKRVWKYYGKAGMARTFMSAFPSAEAANNGMNRLDGGCLATQTGEEEREEAYM